MPLMEWDESMAVHVDELDDQHRQLIALINEAYDAVRRHDEHKRAELVDKMARYARLHFATEEGYLMRYGYPEIEAHKALHAKFNADVDEFRRKMLEKTNLSQIFVFLSRWLITHIMDEDRKYSMFMPKEESHAEE
ncbi:bacteriohemerythrin [Pseudodesulfovibrio cashew]|uniref:Bacteriohemerythrin n=1 Tax=Pseudodesulfovibrio cashew TaxID=2678688 RepID=A0A6I6JKG5_9BACT|nr:bacteriohemerythrin [Pseudodesulfovibrio cashew]QGY40617.1 bacteriohemerythrin [Pseudodesulfovibrio cashew]